jgi:hypothetical protein
LWHCFLLILCNDLVPVRHSGQQHGLGARSLHDIDRSPIVVAPRENRQAEANYFLFQFPGEETVLRFLPRPAAALTVTLDGEW